MKFDDSFYDALEDYMDSFDHVILQRGLDISLFGNVGPLYYDTTKRTISTEVYGTKKYTVSIIMTKDLSSVYQSKCTCPYGNKCKHLFALANNVWSEDYSIEIIESNTSNKPKKNATKITSDRKMSTHILEAPTYEDMLMDLAQFHKKIRYNTWGFHEKQQNILYENGKIKSAKYDDAWDNNRRSIIHTADLHFYDKDSLKSLKISCANCRFTKNKICPIVAGNVWHLLNLTIDSDEEILDYNYFINEISNIENLDKEIVEDLFKLEISENGINFLAKNDNIITPEQINSLNQASITSTTHTEAKTIDFLEKSIDRKEAFAWSTPSGLKSNDFLFLLRGKVNKAGNKISTHIERIDQPVLLSEDAKHLYHELCSNNLNYETELNYANNPNKISNTINLIKENINNLIHLNHFCYHSTYPYRSNDNKIKKTALNAFSFSDIYYNINIKATKKRGLYAINTIHKIGDERIDINKIKKIQFTWHFVILDDIAYVYDNPNTFALHNLLGNKSESLFLPKYKNDFFGLLDNLEKNHTVERDTSISESSTYITKLKKQITLKEVGHHVLFYPELTKNRKVYKLLDPKPTMVKNVRSKPDPQEIIDYKVEFENLHPKFIDNTDQTTFKYLHRDEYIKDGWHLDFFEKCKTQKIKLTGQESFEKMRFSSHKAVIESEISSSIDWFELEVALTFGEEKVDRKKWIAAIKAGQQYVELEDGSLGLIPDEWFQKMSKMIALGEVSKNGLRINKLRFNVIDQLFDEIKDKAVLDDIYEKRRRLENYNTEDKKALPINLKANLRPYQEDAYQWLRFLESCHFGGILADDMGLGKTLQIITLLAHAKETNGCNALVIVPKSLIFNWVNEIGKFYPDFTYHIHHGTLRHENKDDINNANIVLSTYGTIAKDITEFSNKKFTHIILDESQAIKNPASKRYKAIRLLQSPFKLCVTGTPIQNNTFDLFAQASFANPGLLGNQTFFRQNFANPIDKEGDSEASELLLNMIHPFILRRTKEQVAKDLPDKVETTLYCEMYPHQRKMYTELKGQIRRDLLNMDDGDSSLKFMVLDGLLRLRQLCNSPLLVDKTLNSEEAKSIKIDSLINTLTDDIGDGNALVFSQFVQMLTLIRKELDARKIPYAYLDGKTRKREDVVNKFMTDDKCKIFLISLKAGNTGLNLTKAQYVFIVDPWWNPAVEAQAIDRTHRIGQKQKVFAYKMICKDTIEEKIILLQQRKNKVAKKLIQTDEAVFKSLDKKDLMALFD